MAGIMAEVSATDRVEPRDFVAVDLGEDEVDVVLEVDAALSYRRHWRRAAAVQACNSRRAHSSLADVRVLLTQRRGETDGGDTTTSLIAAGFFYVRSYLR